MSRETVIKKVNKRKAIGVPMMLIGVVIFFVSAIFAIVLEAPFTALLLNFFKLSESYLPGPDFLISPTLIFPSTARLFIAIVLWLIFLALSYAVVAGLAGRDPEGPAMMNHVMSSIQERKLYNRTKAKRRF